MSVGWLHPPVAAADLRAAADLLDAYRQDAGQQPAGTRTRDWLAGELEHTALSVVVARREGVPVGIATTHRAPATHLLGHVVVLRDLYVVARARRQGVAAELVSAVRDAAAAGGAVRLSLQTEPGNAAALRLYRGLGFEPVDGVVALALALTPRAGPGRASGER